MLRWLIGIYVVTAAFDAHAVNSLRIATFNINCNNVNLRDIERVVAEADADVVCVQESTQRSEQFLRMKFAAAYPHATFVGHEGRYKEERFGFLSKNQLHEVTYVPPVHGLFGTYLATIRHNGQLVRIVNVHLSPFIIRRSSTFGQSVQAISAAESVHKQEIAAICRQIDPDRPTLVCGDFNSLSTLAAPQRLVSLGLTDSFAATTANPDAVPTWRWKIGNSQLRFRIDYIFHTKHFKTTGSQVLRSNGSDHALLISTLKLALPSNSDAVELETW